MYKHLFFCDRYLFNRQNVKRSYGVPRLETEAIYCDGIVSTAWPGTWVFPLDNGKYRMIYQGGYGEENKERGAFSAISEDGIHFEPENLHGDKLPDSFYAKHQVMKFDGDWEIMYIIEDKVNNPKERYKLLCTRLQGLDMIGDLYSSPDLISWKLHEEKWSMDGEPIGGAFYNDKKKCFTIISRPAWSSRISCWSETTDWKAFTPKTLCLQSDSLDGPLDEIYGMRAFNYDGWYIGFAHIYSGFEGGMSSKYASGTMKAQLAFSYNGNNWFRSLREPFIGGEIADKTGSAACPVPMVWPTSIICKGDEILIYGSASLLEHGPAFHSPGLNGRIFVYRLRKDGFIRLESTGGESIVATKENVWHGGEVHINILAKKATIAVYESPDCGVVSICKPIEGYTHEDCESMTGDLCDWVPTFKSGKTLNELKDRVLAFEIKFSDGEIYSISGEMTPVTTVEGVRWKVEGRLPNYL